MEGGGHHRALLEHLEVAMPVCLNEENEQPFSADLMGQGPLAQPA